MCQDTKIDNKDPSRQKVLLVEYQAAQSSAQHHDQLVWTVTSIIWGSSLILIGFILKSPLTLLGVIISITLCVLGLILTMFVWSAQRQFRYLRNTKYARCKVIEEELGMEQHLKTKWPAGSQTRIYSVIMVLFLVAWFLVGMSVVWNYLTSIRQQYRNNITIRTSSLFIKPCLSIPTNLAPAEIILINDPLWEPLDAG